MKYMGSKDKISLEIKEILDLNRTNFKQAYYEPMCGGCNMMDKIKGKRFASDNNKYLIALWKGLQQDLSRPKIITKQMHSNAMIDHKNNSNQFYNDFLIGWIGFMASYNGIFFAGYNHTYKETRKSKKIRTDTEQSINNIEKQIKFLKDVNFSFSDYSEVNYIINSLIYFDIPYFNTAKYKTGSFDYNKFYDFAESKSNEGHKVFISEYWMPEDRFIKIWQKQINCGIVPGNPKKQIECLFIPKNQIIKQQQTIF